MLVRAQERRLFMPTSAGSLLLFQRLTESSEMWEMCRTKVC